MPGKAYNAGTIFLQVVPVFKDLQDTVRREAKDLNKALGDDMEKGGRDAGKRAAKGIDEGFGDGMSSFDRKVRDSAKNASKALEAELSPGLRRIRKDLGDLSSPDITPDLDAETVMRDMRRIATELKALAKNSKVDVKVKTDAAAAYAKMVPLMKAFSAIDGKTLHVNVDLDAGAAAAKAGLLRSIFLPAKGDAEGGANAFRSFNIVILATLTLLPALVPALAAVGGGLAALIPILGAVGAGLGVMLIGFSGLAPVIKGYSDVQKNAGQDALIAGKRIRGAARSIADAERSLARARQQAAQQSAAAARAVADARRNAADTIESAIEQEKNAEQDLADAKRDSLRAEQDLREARRAAAEELKAAADDRARNALDVRQGLVDVFNATVAYNTTMQDGSSTNLDKEVASIELERSRLALKEARDEQKKLTDEKKKSDKQGVNGSETVTAAQDALTAALERQRDAQKAVGDAAQAVRDAQVQGTRAVQDALRAQHQAAVSGAQSVADAQRNLTQAQEDYTTAVSETSASQRNLNDALSKVGPAGEKFAKFIYGLRDEAYALRDAIQEAMLPGVQAGLQHIIDTYGPQFQAFAARMGGVVGHLFRQAGQGLGSRPWQEFFSTYSKLAPRLLRQFGETTGNWMTVYAEFFTLISPYVERLSDAMLRLSKRALRFMGSAKGKKVWTDFMDYVSRVGPKVWDFFMDMFGAFIAIGKALAPLGELVLGALDGIFKWIKNMDPKTLSAIATAIVGIFVAFQLAVGITSVILAGAAAFTTLAGIFVFALIAVGVAIFIAYQNSETFRNAVHKAWKSLEPLFKRVWNEVLKPILGALGKALLRLAEYVLPVIVNIWIIAWKGILNAILFAWPIIKVIFMILGALIYAVFLGVKWAWEHILHPVFKAIWTVVKFMWKILKPIFKLIWETFKFLARAMAWTWHNILWPIIDLFITAIKVLWKNWVKPILGWIGRRWETVARGIKWVWDHVLKPVFSVFTDVVLPKLKTAFKNAVDWIKDKWESLRAALTAPIRFVIEKIINAGIIRAFNWIANKVGSTPMKEVPVPEWMGHFARGGTAGVYPGYTPGRDVGFIGVSGGEAIMRPEFTRGVGEDWVEQWNKIAREEGVEGVRRRFHGGFKRGGIVWPVPGHQTGTYPGHNGVDINRGSGWDDYGDPIVAFRDGTITYVGTGRGYGKAIMERGPGYPEVVYGHTSRQYVHSGQRVIAGQLIGRVGSTGNSTAPHLHFGLTSGGTTANALALLNGASIADLAAFGLNALNSEGGGLPIPGWVKDVLGGPVKWLRDRVSDKFGDFAEKFGKSDMAKIMLDVPKHLLGGVGSKIKDMVNAFKDKLQSAASAVGHVIQAGSGTGNVRDDVRKVATSYGWGDGAQWSALGQIIAMESGWNPYADNPNSSAAGLFQKMTSIHGPLEKTIIGQAKWGLNYIHDRYGTPTRALAFHKSHGWYSDGGVVPESAPGPDNGTMMYDNGGYLPPGLTTVLNMTGKPEPVFTSEQFESMGAGGAPVHYEPHFHKTDLTSRDVAFDLDIEFRRLGRSSKRYAGKS